MRSAKTPLVVIRFSNMSRRPRTFLHRTRSPRSTTFCSSRTLLLATYKFETTPGSFSYFPDLLAGFLRVAIYEVLDGEKCRPLVGAATAPDWETRSAVEEIFTECTGSHCSLEVAVVAASTRTSTKMGWLPPTRSNSRSWSTRIGHSASRPAVRRISSRKIVPTVGQLKPPQMPLQRP